MRSFQISGYFRFLDISGFPDISGYFRIFGYFRFSGCFQIFGYFQIFPVFKWIWVHSMHTYIILGGTGGTDPPAQCPFFKMLRDSTTCLPGRKPSKHNMDPFFAAFNFCRGLLVGVVCSCFTWWLKISPSFIYYNI